MNAIGDWNWEDYWSGNSLWPGGDNKLWRGIDYLRNMGIITRFAERVHLTTEREWDGCISLRDFLDGDTPNANW